MKLTAAVFRMPGAKFLTGLVAFPSANVFVFASLLLELLAHGSFWLKRLARG
jgi:hypothetical protein